MSATAQQPSPATAQTPSNWHEPLSTILWQVRQLPPCMLLDHADQLLILQDTIHGECMYPLCPG